MFVAKEGITKKMSLIKSLLSFWTFNKEQRIDLLCYWIILEHVEETLRLEQILERFYTRIFWKQETIHTFLLEQNRLVRGKYVFTEILDAQRSRG